MECSHPAISGIRGNPESLGDGISTRSLHFLNSWNDSFCSEKIELWGVADDV